MKEDEKTAMKNRDEGLAIANIPRGLSAALASDLRAMQIFSEMPEEPRNSFINGARSITDRGEMRRYVSEIKKNVQG